MIMNIRDHLNSMVNRSGAARKVFGSALDALGRLSVGLGWHYRAAAYHCLALRHLPMDEAGRHLEGLRGILNATCLDEEGKPRPITENRLLRQYRLTSEAHRLRRAFAAQPTRDRVRLRWHREPDDPTRQGNLILLKAPVSGTCEKGVLLLKYNNTFAQLPAVFDMAGLVRHYRIVLEPSSHINIHEAMLLYACAETDVVVLCNHAGDRDFYEWLGQNFCTIRLGAGCWVDLEVFQPEQSTTRDYDLIMVASWARLKRHRTLFSALAKLLPRSYRVALVGYPHLKRTRADIESEMRTYGISAQCEIFESIPPGRVAALLSRSKVALMLSEAEGANKAAYEAMACDTPVIVYRHNIGFNKDHINPATGVLANDDELPDAIIHMVENHKAFRARDWVLSNVSYNASTIRLNTLLHELAKARGEPWTSDILPKVNRPNLRYASETDRIAMEPAYEELTSLLVGHTRPA